MGQVTDLTWSWCPTVQSVLDGDTFLSLLCKINSVMLISIGSSMTDRIFFVKYLSKKLFPKHIGGKVSGGGGRWGSYVVSAGIAWFAAPCKNSLVMRIIVDW